MRMRVVIILTLSIFAASAVYAQPPGDSPGATSSRYQAQMERERRDLSKKKPVAPKLEVEKETKAPAPTGPSFTLKEIAVTGSSIFTVEELKPLYDPYIGRTVSFADLEAIAKKIEEKYAKKGYLTTSVYIPDQQVEDGKVQIAVVEGKVNDVKVEGTKWFPADLLKKWVHSKKNEVLNIFSLQRDILRLNQNPDLQAPAVLEAVKGKAGFSDIVFKVKDKFPYHAGVSVDNQGTRLGGYYRTSFSFRSSDLSANNDSLFVNVLVSPGARGEFISYTLPIDRRGAAAGFDFSYFTTKLRKEFSDADITGNSFLYQPHITQEIYLAEALQVGIEYGIEIKSTNKAAFGAKTTLEELRMPYFSFDLTTVNGFFGGGQNSFIPKFLFSCANFLGSSDKNQPEASRQATCGGFFVYSHSFSRTQVMPFESFISLRSQLQLASRTLPSSEQLQLGGANTIRGYPEGDYLADYGAILNMDWVFPCYIMPKDVKFPFADRPLRNQLQPVLFMDLGGGKINKVMTGERKQKFLMGLGGGLQFTFNRNLTLRALWAQSVGERPTGGQGPSGFHLSFRYET